MKIYHGSKEIIKQPVCKGSNQENDYGPAFYLTLDFDAAKSWACKNEILGLVNIYDIDKNKFKELKILDLTNKEKYSVLNWLAILMHFRKIDPHFFITNKESIEWLKKYYIDVDCYDVIVGFRADDSYFRFPLSFINNSLAFEDLEYVFKLGKLGIQYAFISEKALNLLKFKKSVECEESFIGDYYSKISEATKVFNELVHRPKSISKHYIIDLMRQEKNE